MKPTVYIDTSVVSYLTARPSRDLIIAAYQQVTREWWESAGDRFSLAASALVREEPARGDPGAARARLQALEGIALLQVTQEARRLARSRLAIGLLPRTAAIDALHIAVAAAHGLDYLVTWTFRHIANVAVHTQLERTCRDAGYEPPVMCSPHQLLEIGHGDLETRLRDC